VALQFGQLGLKGAKTLRGGYRAWVKQGQPVAQGDEAEAQ